MSGGGGSGPTMDPAVGVSANKQAELGEQWLAFSKEQFGVSTKRQAELDALTKQVTEQQLGIATDQAAWSKSDRERYETTFKPIEDKFVADATNYATPEKQAEAAAEAKADVSMSAAAARGASERSAASMGINPNSGRFAGIDRTAELANSLATAGAQNTARQAVRDKGLALQADVVNLGRGLPTQSAQAASVGLSSGGSAVGLNQQNQNLFNSSTGIVGAGYGGASAGYGNQAATLQNQYNANLSAYNADQANASANFNGIAGAVGTAAGLFLSDENLKEDKQPIEDGAALDAVNELPVESWKYKDGIADEGQHVGTYAQDFSKVTGSGDGHAIKAQDAIGLTMKAVQDLDKKVEAMAQAIGLAGATSKVATMKRKPKADLAPADSEAAPVDELAAATPSLNDMPGLGMRRAA